jgi:hypothetical protein
MVRRAFAEQSRFCAQLGSPFTALLCDVFAARLDDSTEIGKALLSWSGDPSPKADSLPLRVAGAVHGLARTGRCPALSKCYPPNALPDATMLWNAIAPLLDSEQTHFKQYLQQAPQTNEVGRSALLLAGLLEVAQCTRTPLRLFEIGASAGLNLIPDRYRYQFGSVAWGSADARLCLQPQWSGGVPPVDASLDIVGRYGVDLNPLDLADSEQRARLLSYVWADQVDRLVRVEAAIDTALEALPVIERMDAADWLERYLKVDGEVGVTQVLTHSIVWSYLSQATRGRIEAHVHACAAHANSERPLAWVRFELTNDASTAALSVTIWPGGVTRELALGHPHGSKVHYLG